MKKILTLLALLIIVPSFALGATQNSTNNVAAAGSLTGTTLASGVTASSLTTVGTIGTGTWQGTILNPTYGGTGINNAAKTITLGGNLTTSGANNITLTTTGTTSVTLPTSGTLTTTTGTAGTASALANNTANTLAGFNNSGVYADVAIGSGLSLSGGTLTAPGSGGTVTTTGSPASGNLTKFSGASSIVNGDLSGDVTTSGALATTLATVNSNVGSFTNASITVNGKGLITAASSGAGGLGTGLSTTVTVFDDFNYAQDSIQPNWLSTISGTAAAVTSGILTSGNLNAGEKANGVMGLSCGTTTIGSASLSKQTSSGGGAFPFGNQTFDYTWRVRIPAVSTGTNRFVTFIGLNNTVTTTFANLAALDTACGFRQTDLINGGNWQVVCANNGTESVINTSTAADTSYHTFEETINSAGTSTQFFIDGVSQGTTTTNIPSGGRVVFPQVAIAGSLGVTSARQLIVDYFNMVVGRI